jgi:oligoendopeptidase F
LAKPAPVPSLREEGQVRVWLDSLEQKLEEMSIGYNEASYNKYIGRANGDLNQYDAAFSVLLGEPSYQTAVRYWLPKVSDPLLRRRLALFQRTTLEAEVSKSQRIYELRNSINEQLISFRPSVHGMKLTRSDILEILRSNPDRNWRRTVFEEGLRPLAVRLSSQVRELIQRRNIEAQRLGYQDYVDLHLELLGIDRTTLFNLFDQLEELTDRPYRAFLEESAEQAQLSQLEQWDLNFLAEQRANLPVEAFRREQILPRIFEFLGLFGLEAEKLPIQVRNQDLPFGGLCFSIQIPRDVRILANPKDGYPYYRTMFHEFGHGLHSVFNRQTSYILKREGGIFNEGMAETLAYFTHHPEWLENVSGLPSAEIERYTRENMARRLLRFRSLMAQARFEIEAYSSPNSDLDRLNAEIEARYLLTPPNYTPRWAASSFPTTHPLYRQNYILAEMIAAQVHATLRQRFGDFFQLSPATRSDVFNFLVENFYAPGASLDWAEKLNRTTGQGLSVTALAAELL